MPCSAIVIPPRGRLVLAAWAGIPCAILAPFVFWQGLWAGLFFTLLALLAAFAVWGRACSFAASIAEDALHLYAGIVFSTVRFVPQASVCGAARYTTPLLSLAGCRILILYTPGGAVWLPGLACGDADALCAWAQHAAVCGGKKENHS